MNTIEEEGAEGAAVNRTPCLRRQAERPEIWWS